MMTLLRMRVARPVLSAALLVPALGSLTLASAQKAAQPPGVPHMNAVDRACVARLLEADPRLKRPLTVRRDRITVERSACRKYPSFD